MAFDAARGQVVLLSRSSNADPSADTWVWNGMDWRQRHPGHSPPGRYGAGMAYDSSRGEVVLFGGTDGSALLSDTWTWDGTDWTHRTPAHAPSLRDYLSLAFDAQGHTMLFGGYNGYPALGDTWTWDGTDWAVPYAATLALTPSSGPPETDVLVEGWSFGAKLTVELSFADPSGTTTLGTLTTDSTGAFSAHIKIPLGAVPGDQRIRAAASTSGQRARRTFTVT